MTMNFLKWPPHLVRLAAPTLSKMIDQAAAYETSKDYPAALTVCNQILALDPLNRVAYQLRGIVRLQLNDTQNGRNDLDTAQSLFYQSPLR